MAEKLHYTETRLLQEVFENQIEELELDKAEKLLLIAKKLEIHTLTMHNIVSEKSKQLPF